MAGILLAAFPLLLLVAPRLAWLVIAVAIVMLVTKRLGAARPTRSHVDDEYDASI